jgi:hypothetical protein
MCTAFIHLRALRNPKHHRSSFSLSLSLSLSRFWVSFSKRTHENEGRNQSIGILTRTWGGSAIIGGDLLFIVLDELTPSFFLYLSFLLLSFLLF